MERMAPLEAWIGGNRSGCHCRQSSMLYNIGGARTRTFLKLTSRWRSDIFSVLVWGVFGVWQDIEPIWHLYNTIGVNESFNLRYLAYLTQVLFGRYAVFRKACFLYTTRMYILEIVCVASAEKKIFHTRSRRFYSNTHPKTERNARRGSIIANKTYIQVYSILLLCLLAVIFKYTT